MTPTSTVAQPQEDILSGSLKAIQVGIAALVLAGCAAQSSIQVAPATPASPGAFLPPPEDLPGATEAGQITEFARQDLWVNLNGAAAIYEDYGCQRLATRDYMVEDVALTAKIFAMERPLYAFGLFGQLRAAESRPLLLGNGGALGHSDLIFWQGKYFASVLLRDPGQRQPELLERVGRALSARLPPATGRPSILALLPEENRVPHTEQYIRQNGLGYGFLYHGVTAEYRLGEGLVRLYVFQLGGQEEALRALEEMVALLSHRRPLEPPLGEQSAAGIDDYAGETALFAQREFLVVAQGEADRKAVSLLLEQCAASLAFRDFSEE